MKKVIVSLLVLALAATSVFAGVNFSGDFVTGYVFNANKNAADEWKWSTGIFGQDNLDTNQTQLNLGIADDNGVWALTFEGEIMVDGTAFDSPKDRIATDITLDLAKLIMGDTDWTAKLQLLANDRITALRAYSNKSGLNYDRVRTTEPGLWANAIVGYGDLLQVQIGGAPALTATADNAGGKTYGDFIVSAMTKPISGLAVSVDWALVGDGGTNWEESTYIDGINAGIDDAIAALDPDTDADAIAALQASKVSTAGSFEAKTAGVIGAAADVNIGEMLGLDFNIGVGVADKYYYGENRKTNVLAAQVYGGIDLLSAYVEYVNWYCGVENYPIDMVNMLHFGIDLNVIEGLILNVYTGAGDLEHYGDSFYVGGNIGYEVAGVTFQLNLQYDEGGYMTSVGGDVSNGAVKAQGFSITPMVKVSF